VVAPGGDPTRIRLRFEGARELRVDGEGQLVAALDGGEVVNRMPRIYQEEGTRKVPVRGRWILRGKSEAGFEVEAHDPRRSLAIDPVLSYSTYLGGNSIDFGHSIAMDGSGSAYVTGYTVSIDFPTQNPFQADQPFNDAFVTKLSPSGNSLVYSTYLGGSLDDLGFGICVDSSGSAYVTGSTDSSDFPTQNPFQTDQPENDVFVTKLSPSGNSLVYSTYLGGNSYDQGSSIAVDGSGSAYVTGYTWSTEFPTQNPFQMDQPGQDAFVTKLSPSGNGLVYSTYLGGGSSLDVGRSITLDRSGSAYVTGETDSTDFPTQNPYQAVLGLIDAFVTKLSPSGNSLVYSTYLGGASGDFGFSIALDGSGSAYVTGYTESTDFPTQNPYQTDQPDVDAFVTKLSPSGNSLVYSTYLGGNSDDGGYSIAVDSSGSAYVTGYTESTDFPTQNPFQMYQSGWDAFVTKLSLSGNSLVYSTYLGGNFHDAGQSIALDASGSAYVTGDTDSTDFPTQNPFQTVQGSGDAFVTKLSLPPMDFFTLAPCRLIDTRNTTGPYGGPALIAGADRTFTLAGQCGIPATARAVSVNVAVTAPSATGHLRLYPAGTSLPGVSSINYAPGQTRSNNAIASLNTGGAVTVRCVQASGTVDLILDVNGYFE
jgi:hypothetical protein